MRVEAVMLTGGRSSRMGTDKASLVVDGESLAQRTARLLKSVADCVTVLGREPVSDCLFVEDQEQFEGPLVALAAFQASAPYVFVAACDLFHFDPLLVTFLADRMEQHPSVMALVPVLQQRPQPLSALYRGEAFDIIPTVRAEGKGSMMAWLDMLWVERIEENEIRSAGIDPRSLVSFDTPAAFCDVSNKSK